MSTQRAAHAAALIVEELGVPAEVHVARVFGTFQLPGIAVAQPVIGLLDLIAVGDVLAEHAVLVAYAVAHHRQLQRCAAVEKAGCQAPQAAVAEAGVVLGLRQLLHQQAKVAQGAGCGVGNPQVEQCIAQRAPHQELE